MNASLLVMGGGIAGMTAAIEAAELGRETLIVEREWYLGGRVMRLSRYFPKMCPPYCGLEINLRRIRANPLVHYMVGAEVVEVRGGPGAYEADIRLRPRYINEDCTACGDCEKAAETEVPSEFDYGMSKRKAAYLPHPMAFPARYVLDKGACDTAELSAVKDSCTYGAVDLEDAEKTVTVKAGAVVVATGWKPYEAERLDRLGAGRLKNVIRNVEMERLCSVTGPTNGKVLRPSDGKAPKRIAFVQCAGSRDENHLSYCSAVCCSATLKQADQILEENPDAQVEVFYIDVRTPGRLEKFASRVMENERLILTKGKVAEIEETQSGEVILTAEDAISGVKVRRAADLVVLATGMAPTGVGRARIGGLSLDEDGFVAGGLTATGCASAPLDVASSVEDATAATLEALAMGLKAAAGGGS